MRVTKEQAINMIKEEFSDIDIKESEGKFLISKTELDRESVIERLVKLLDGVIVNKGQVSISSMTFVFTRFAVEDL